MSPGIAWLGLGGVALILCCGASAWVGEDAHITFRTIDNFVNGYGLRWNVDERVQTFTHPLWLFVNAAVYTVTREIYTTTTAIGIVCTVTAYAIVGWRLRANAWALVLGWITPLLLSQSIVRYATSGFENSLSYLLLAVFAVTLMDDAKRGAAQWRRLVLVTALASVNRLDTVLLYLPVLVALAWREREQLSLRPFVEGAAPAVAWFGFATFYYGFPLPNTALAKLNPELSWGAHLRQGVSYVGELAASDPVTFAAIVFAVLSSAWMLRAPRGRHDRDPLAWLAAGSFLYCAYVISIGGDFLSGRFWALPAFAAITVFATRIEPIVAALRALSPVRAALALGFAAVSVTALVLAGPALLRDARSRQILELPVARKSLDAGFEWKASPVAESVEALARAARTEAERSDTLRVTTGYAVGFSGYYSGPRFTIIDLHALTDPLLARLPPEPNDELHIGHFARALPRGYLHARRTGSLDGMDPELRDYYAKLRLVTSGPLASGERLRAVGSLWLSSPPP